MSQQNGTSDETSAVARGFISIASIAFVFFCGPYFYRTSIGFVQAFAQANYGLGGALIDYFWMFVIAFGGFGFAKLVIFLLLKLGLFGIAANRGQ